MTRWPEIGSEAFETPLDSSIFGEDPSPEIKSDDMRDGDIIFPLKRGGITFSKDRLMVDNRREDTP